MKNELTWFSKVRLVLSVSALYISTIGVAWYSLQAPPAQTTVHAAETISRPTTKSPEQIITSGKPTRIVIQDRGVDLSVDEGHYIDDGSWTLSDTNAQYAVISSPANDQSGNTFIYGHATDKVFGKLAQNPPALNSTALIYTNNGHILAYEYIGQQDFSPTDTSIFQYDGPPTLTVQTCTGPFSEFRTFFKYDFKEVVR